MKISRLELLPPFLWYEEYDYLAPYRSALHTHPAWQLTFSHKGEFYFETQGERITITPGEWVLFSPALPHSAGSDSESSRAIQIFFRHFPPALLVEYARSLNFRRNFFLKGSWDREAGAAIAERFSSVGKGGSALPLSLKNILSLRFVSEALESAVARMPVQREIPENFLKVLEFMERHIASSVGVPDFAALVDLSESRFSALFRQMTGVPPMHYFNELRLCQAQLLLLGGASVRSAALSSGFASASFFCRQFKKYTGMTPEAWRKNCRSENLLPECRF